MPTATHQLSERKAAILRALVRHYIRTGEPVGSEALAHATGLNVSSATVRNELAALEELGYLMQPHTSAGRAPTDLAYRFFVDSLSMRPKLRESERRQVVHFFDEALADVDAILRGTTQLLSRLTRYASLALAPTLHESPIVRAELIGLGSTTLLLVVFDTGRVEKRAIDVPAATTDEEIERITREVLGAVRGRSLADAKADLARREADARGIDAAILHDVIRALDSIDEGTDADHLVLRGVANIAAEESFRRRETLRQIYDVLERESAVLRMLREAASSEPLGIVIGRENPMPEMWETSVVAAPYRAGGAVGAIGVVGPTRMDYEAAIATVRVVAQRLSSAVDALRGEGRT